MRPKKRILLIDCDEARRQVLAYTLHIRGFAVLPVPDPWQAKALVAEHGVDVIVGVWPLPAAAFVELLLRGRQSYGTTSILLAHELSAWPDGVLADQGVFGRASSQEIFEHIRRMAGRRRGPQPVMKPVMAGQSTVDGKPQVTQLLAAS